MFCFRSGAEREAVNVTVKRGPLLFGAMPVLCQIWAGAGCAHLPAQRSPVHSRRRDKHRDRAFLGKSRNASQIQGPWGGRQTGLPGRAGGYHLGKAS